MTTTLYVLGNPAAPAGNAPLIAALNTAFGADTVTTRDDGDANKSVAGFDLLVLGSDTLSSNLTAYLSTAIPKVVLAHAVTDDLLMIPAATAMTSNSTRTDMTVLPDTNLVAFSVGSQVRYTTDSNMGPGAEVLARWVGVVGTNVAAWRYDVGDTLADGATTATQRMVFTPPLSESGSNATTALIDFFVSQASWAVGTTPPPGPDPITGFYNYTGGALPSRYWSGSAYV